MSMSDPIADLLTRMRNALSAGHSRVDVPASRIKEDICNVLQEQGYILGYTIVGEGARKTLQISLKYDVDGRPTIREIKRISKPSLRVYARSRDLRPVRGGLGMSIVTTSQGVMTAKQARKAGIGGEVLCQVW